MRFGFLDRLRAPANTDFTILIPVYDETKALVFSKFYFDAIGAKPLYVLNSNRISRQKEVENIVQQPVPIYNNPGLFLEAGFDQYVAQAPTDWILRIECDEAPMPEALSFCREFIRQKRRGIGLFDRSELRWQADHFQEIIWPDYTGAQWRFFNRSRVKFDHAIHTGGLKVPTLGRFKAPIAAQILHLDMVFNSQQEIEEKHAGYERAGHVKSATDLVRENFSWRATKHKGFEEIYRRWLNYES